MKWLNKLAVKPVEQEWTLVLAGALTEEMDRATFETGAAEGCHGQDWKDAEGNTWTGIPLYLLVGRVDDDNVHEGPAYNRDLAEAGYDVEIVTSGSGTITVSEQDHVLQQATPGGLPHERRGIARGILAAASGGRRRRCRPDGGWHRRDKSPAAGAVGLARWRRTRCRGREGRG